MLATRHCSSRGAPRRESWHGWRGVQQREDDADAQQEATERPHDELCGDVRDGSRRRVIGARGVNCFYNCSRRARSPTRTRQQTAQGEEQEGGAARSSAWSD
jgi:hypothetical protein